MGHNRGLIPGILVPEPKGSIQPHIGTRDVDLAIRVAAVGNEEELYRTLKNNLAALKLAQTSGRSFEWKRTVDGFDVVVELFVPVNDPSQGGKIQQKPIEKGGSGLTALGVYGLDLIERDVVEIEDEGPLLDEKGIKNVQLRVCGPAMLVALKAWALTERNKTKDGYDVVWILRAQGAEAVARRFLECGLKKTDFGRGAIDRLCETFASPDHVGPIGWVEESGFKAGERARERREAAGVVREFLRLLDVQS